MDRLMMIQDKVKNYLDKQIQYESDYNSTIQRLRSIGVYSDSPTVNIEKSKFEQRIRVLQNEYEEVFSVFAVLKDSIRSHFGEGDDGHDEYIGRCYTAVSNAESLIRQHITPYKFEYMRNGYIQKPTQRCIRYDYVTNVLYNGEMFNYLRRLLRNIGEF